ncbi:MAG: hypothetical protein E7256_09590 [Lachnospiraceae bacterium]|nr:hypothetical protein [Lachnospiraceae bacterium]
MVRTGGDWKKEIRKLKFELHFLEDIPCSKEENTEFKKKKLEGMPLPEEIKEYVNEAGEGQQVFYREKVNELTKEEMEEYRNLKQLESFRNIERIKNSVIVMTITFCIILFIVATR